MTNKLSRFSINIIRNIFEIQLNIINFEMDNQY